MKDDQVYLNHIWDAILKIESYIDKGYDEFIEKSYLQDAVIRQLEIIGEATKNVSNDLRIKHSNIPWKRIAGLRDVLIHDYMGVDISAVWQVTQKDLPKFKKNLKKIITRCA